MGIKLAIVRKNGQQNRKLYIYIYNSHSFKSISMYIDGSNLHNLSTPSEITQQLECVNIKTKRKLSNS